jgi:hypothetical protein
VLKFGLFFLISLCVSIAAQAQTGWTISVIGPQQILFEKPREHLSALLNVEAVPFATQDVRDYLRSPGFLQDGKRSRTLDSLHLAASRIDVVVSREQIGEQWIGITESAFAIDDHAALLTERCWVRDGLSFLKSSRPPSEFVGARLPYFGTTYFLRQKRRRPEFRRRQEKLRRR